MRARRLSNRRGSRVAGKTSRVIYIYTYIYIYIFKFKFFYFLFFSGSTIRKEGDRLLIELAFELGLG